MADDLSFTISAEDQASKVVDTVKSKLNNFGSDLAKMALGVAGPMALVSQAIGYVMKRIDEYKQAKLDAENEIIKREEDAAKAFTDKEMAEYKKRVEAYKKAEDEKTAAKRKAESDRIRVVSLNEEIEQLKSELSRGGEPLTGADLLKDLGEKIRRLESDRKAAKGFDRPLVDIKELEKKSLELQIQYAKEFNKNVKEGEASRIKAIYAEAERLAIKPGEFDEEVKQPGRLTVSSLREIGGSFGGGDINTGIERQVELAQKQVDVLTKIEQNTTPRERIDTLAPGSTNFTVPGGASITSQQALSGEF
jgi:hypothetical protein